MTIRFRRPKEVSSLMLNRFRSEVKSRPVSALVRSSYSNPVQAGSDGEEDETDGPEEMASSREKWKVMDYR